MRAPSKAAAAKQAVVLEVGPHAAKMMAATTSPFHIQRLNASTLPGQTEDPVAALRALLEVQPLGAREAGLLFGREMFSLRRLELPSTAPKEIASMLELQLGKLTPYPRAEILSAWTVVGSFREGYTTILLAIARKAPIEGVIQLLKSKGIAPLWAGVSTEGLEAWVASAKQGGQLLALIDIDFASTDCAILSSDGRLLFTHSIGIGYEQLSTGDQAALRLVGELIRLPRILLHEEIKGQIGRGLITGAWLPLEHIVEQLTSQWGVPVEVRDALEPFARVEIRERAKATHVSYTALVGALASNRSPRIDLIPRETRVSQALQVRSKQLARLAVNLAGMLSIALLFYALRWFTLEQYLRDLRERLIPLERTSQEIMRRQEAMRTARQWLDPAESALSVIQAVASASDPAVTITQLSFKEGEPVKIRGTAGTSQAPYEFLDRLKQQKMMAAWSSCLAEVRVTGSRGAEFDILCKSAES